MTEPTGQGHPAEDIWTNDSENRVFVFPTLF